MQEINEQLKIKFEQTYTALRRDLTRVRTGRANANILDGVRVDYYGTPTPVAQVAAIQIPEARLLTVKPWEASLLKDIERAIINANIGLSPSNDGTLLRLNIPPLTEERRKELGRQVQQLGEQAKVSVRNHRRDANAELKEWQKEGELSEDDLARSLKEVQTLTDAAVTVIDEILSKKQAELEEI
jgi:ribosome recycling factor